MAAIIAYFRGRYNRACGNSPTRRVGIPPIVVWKNWHARIRKSPIDRPIPGGYTCPRCLAKPRRGELHAKAATTARSSGFASAAPRAAILPCGKGNFMRTGTFEDNVLYQLAQTLAGGGRHSTAAALRLLAQAGYATLQQVDEASDWVLLSIRGIGVGRLKEVRQLTRPDWQPPSPQAVHAANWFLSSAQFALRYWPSETLASLIRGSALAAGNGEPVEKRLASDLFSQAVRKALYYCTAEELVRALQQASGGSGGLTCQAHEVSPEPRVEVRPPAAGLAESPAATSCNGSNGARESDRFAHPRHKRSAIVQDYWAARGRGQVLNKDNWARSHYHISGKTLLSYEREYEEAEVGRP